MTNISAVDYADVQGIIRFGYARLTEASFLLLRIRDAAAARAWLATAPISTAVALAQAPATALQIAFTREGLEALKIADEVLAGFSAEFLSGMAGDDNRSRRLGDVGTNSPESWKWGGPGYVPHLLVMLYAQEGVLDFWAQTVKALDWDTAFEVLDSLPTSNLDGIEPFGFTDGISQPLNMATWLPWANFCWVIRMNTASIRTGHCSMKPTRRVRSFLRRKMCRRNAIWDAMAHILFFGNCSRM